ncbi:NAD(P)-dependent malic enzyme [Parafannyhessea umbonata]|uniref:NADP-dependent malic enzyme n=2 Tax=Parafannyhessea umbonata TaxID=604330 RepID=A0A6N7X7K2_9ACTN|nr:NADP-dependent malic enzyme [Parafannyhessea umbonata]MCI6681104.1 NADP-dependent malic enzyme [Parafannyhessea umbonata]MST59563.1 NADP-dependent malic enzyme [Parafannyhessea umbonata]
MDETSAKSLKLHEELQGKIEVVSRAKAETNEDLALLYTPGVAEPCRQIQADYSKSWELTRRSHLVAVITNSTAVLGLGDIGAAAGMPVMEGKCLLFKEFGDVDAFPICVDTHDTDELVRTVQLISKSFGGINLEDIAAPQCFEVEDRLKELCDVPVFHDDQHGTAIVTAAGLLNAVKVTGKKMGELKIVMSGAGAAGLAIATLLTHMGFGNVILCDRKGAIYEGRDGLNPYKQRVAKITNKDHEAGSLADVLVGADAFLGVSKPGLVTPQMVSTMKDGIVFAMANPTPEIMPDEAKAGGAKVVATGRSDFPNQINNVLVFPGIFKGALAARAPQITEEMEIAAAEAIASLVPEDKLSPDFIIPSALDKTVADVVAKAVADRVKK